MLCVVVLSTTITEEQQICEIIRSAQMEWWFYGRAVFEEKTAILRQIILKAKLSEHFEARPLPTYDALWRTWEECSEKTRSVKFT
jgi:hypothetical protein